MAQDNQDNLERMVAMTDAVPASVFQCQVTSGEGPRYRFISGQVHDLLGVTAEELLADPASGWRNVAPDRVEDLRSSLRAQMRSDQADVIDLRAPVVGETGLRWIRLHARAVRSCGDDQIVWNGYYEDVTAQLAGEQAMREAKEEAEAAARAKADFLANMSHEIRTPMTAILGMSHLVMQTGLNARQREYIDKIQRAGRHLLGIINDVLDYSKIEAGKMSAECVDFDLEAILDNVASLAGGIAAASQLELVFDLPADVPTQLRGDPLRLEQVLINLAGNAIKFTGQGEVVVSVRVLERAPAGALLRFEVRDTGIGMNAEECGRLFQSFQQADSSTTRKFGGTGLGLAISRRLVELMNGTLGVESAPGAGSRFWFTVPLGVACERGPLHAPQLARSRALVVDDNASARAVLHARLRELGLEAAQAASGEQALGMLLVAAGEGAPFDYVFIDWELARMDGRRVLRAMHRQPTGGPVPVTIPVAAFVCESTHREVEGLGLPGVLVKPVMPTPLFAALSRGAALPLRQPVQAHPGAPGGGEYGLQDASVLLVEDNEVIRLVVCELLADLGLQVDTAVNGEIALAKVACKRYDLVLMDMQMPVMNGPDAARALRLRYGAGLPIVAMTANVMEADRQRCMDAGMNDFVGKPVEPDELRAVLLRWIGPRRNARDTVAPAPSGGGQDTQALSIDGVDTVAGLLRVNGKLPSYWRQLRTFLGDQGDASARLRAALAEADHVRAAALLHTLRGVAGNIGALALPPLALELERALRKGAGAALPQLCAQFDDELARLLTALRAAMPAEDGAAPAALPGPAQLERVCDTLAALMDENNAEAETLYRERQASFDAAFGHAGAAIGAALERFDFPLAAELLRGARQRRAADANAGADLPIQPE
jgi:two-component system sensor histidine kinase/response regulator